MSFEMWVKNILLWQVIVPSCHIVESRHHWSTRLGAILAVASLHHVMRANCFSHSLHEYVI